MFAPVDDIHHRHRKNACGGATHIAIERLASIISRRLGRRQRHAEDGVGPKARLVIGTVHFDHRHVQRDLFGCVKPFQRVRNFAIYRLDRVQHAFAEVAGLVAIAPLHRFMRARGGAGRHRSPAHGAVFQSDVNLNCRITPTVQYFTRVDVDDAAHTMALLINSIASALS